MLVSLLLLLFCSCFFLFFAWRGNDDQFSGVCFGEKSGCCIKQDVVLEMVHRGEV